MRVSPEIENLVPYAPGKPVAETKREYGLTEVIKLASNENALGPSPMAVKALQQELAELNRYPDPGSYDLKKKLQQKWQVSPEQMVIGNGSNELIDLLIRVFCEPGDRILMPEKSFVAYRVCAQAARVAYHQFPVNRNWQLDIDEVINYLKNKKTSRDKIFFLANPNNPTGSYINKSDIDRLMEVIGGREDLLFVFDEAYDEFVRASDFARGMEYLADLPNVLVSKTFSKVYGLAGLRLGVLLGAQENVQWLERVRNPFNVNTLAQVAAIAALDDGAYLKASQEQVWRGLDEFYEFFKKMNWPFWPSQANFVLFDSLRDSAVVFEELLKKGLIVRPVKGYQMPTEIRVSVGTDQENRRAMEIMAEVLPKIPVVKS